MDRYNHVPNVQRRAKGETLDHSKKAQPKPNCHTKTKYAPTRKKEKNIIKQYMNKLTRNQVSII